MVNDHFSQSELFAHPQIGLAFCKNKTSNGNWCKSEQEIRDFMRVKQFFLVLQKTLVQTDIFENDPLIEKFPYYGDK